MWRIHENGVQNLQVTRAEYSIFGKDNLSYATVVPAVHSFSHIPYRMPPSCRL